MKHFVKIARAAALFGQLGFTIVTPPVVLAIVANWLCARFALGRWVMLPALLIGFMASASGVYRFYRRITADERSKPEKNQKDIVYYHHE